MATPPPVKPITKPVVPVVKPPVTRPVVKPVSAPVTNPKPVVKPVSAPAYDANKDPNSLNIYNMTPTEWNQYQSYATGITGSNAVMSPNMWMYNNHNPKVPDMPQINQYTYVGGGFVADSTHTAMYQQQQAFNNSKVYNVDPQQTGGYRFSQNLNDANSDRYLKAVQDNPKLTEYQWRQQNAGQDNGGSPIDLAAVQGSWSAPAVIGNNFSKSNASIGTAKVITSSGQDVTAQRTAQPVNTPMKSAVIVKPLVPQSETAKAKIIPATPATKSTSLILSGLGKPLLTGNSATAVYNRSVQAQAKAQGKDTLLNTSTGMLSVKPTASGGMNPANAGKSAPQIMTSLKTPAPTQKITQVAPVTVAKDNSAYQQKLASSINQTTASAGFGLGGSKSTSMVSPTKSTAMVSSGKGGILDNMKESIVNFSQKGLATVPVVGPILESAGAKIDSLTHTQPSPSFRPNPVATDTKKELVGFLTQGEVKKVEVDNKHAQTTSPSGVTNKIDTSFVPSTGTTITYMKNIQPNGKSIEKINYIPGTPSEKVESNGLATAAAHTIVAVANKLPATPQTQPIKSGVAKLANDAESFDKTLNAQTGVSTIPFAVPRILPMAGGGGINGVDDYKGPTIYSMVTKPITDAVKSIVPQQYKSSLPSLQKPTSPVVTTNSHASSSMGAMIKATTPIASQKPILSIKSTPTLTSKNNPVMTTNNKRVL